MESLSIPEFVSSSAKRLENPLVAKELNLLANLFDNVAVVRMELSEFGFQGVNL